MRLPQFTAEVSVQPVNPQYRKRPSHEENRSRVVPALRPVYKICGPHVLCECYGALCFGIASI